MNPSSNSRAGASEAPEAKNESDSWGKKTPGTDMQAEDAGTAESGNDAQGTSSEGAMKQTSKTPSETGSKK